MENQQNAESQDQPQSQDESAEEFKQEVEEDPSTAKSSDEDGIEQLRGG